MMRLSAFRIENFRSIVDTGMQNISPDNITCLIGQNESGKTSVLEGLRVFSSGTISEDVLRSDLSLPRVSCRFELPEGYFDDRLRRVNEDFDSMISSLNEVTVVRTWKEDLKSEISIGGEFLDYFEKREEEQRKKLREIEKNVLTIKSEIGKALSNCSELETEINELKDKLPEIPLRQGGLKLFRKRPDGKNENGAELSELKLRIEKREKEIEKIKEYLDKNAEISSAISELDSYQTEKLSIQERLDELSVKLEERHQTMTLLSGPSIIELSHGEWGNVLNDYDSVSRSLLEVNKKIDYNLYICAFIMDGKDAEEAGEMADIETGSIESEYTARELGELCFGDCPSFGIFEDFGSLLPNRIDLDDMLSGNQQVEGYKAANNFLTLAELDYSFFQQPSSRILKQKIENLNSKLTLDFQDFWQQYVGSRNKIRINFELDHYSTSHGEKAGQPFLEFWVKDEGERLYPKQRSRGVRWFLSFYLELMAASKRERKHLVLLVDEPGVSLHARAQEDVLKVFEDIKDNIQIIYTTHSPHLVDINKLHRVLAIQRDDLENTRSATTVLDAARLSDASPDTLSPLQSIMGNPVGSQEFSVDKYNIIVNNVGTFYLMNAVMNLTGYKGRIHFIPSTDASSIPLMCNILMGWGMKFAVLLFNNEEEQKISLELSKMVFTDKPGKEDSIMMMPEEFNNAEDLISTLDFKKYIAKTREGITISNSEYVEEKQLPRNFLMSKFLSEVKAGKVRRDDLDEETREKLMLLVNVLQKFK